MFGDISELMVFDTIICLSYQSKLMIFLKFNFLFTNFFKRSIDDFVVMMAIGA